MSDIYIPPTMPLRSRQELSTYVLQSIRDAGVKVPVSSRFDRMHRLLHSSNERIAASDPDFEMALEAERDIQLLAYTFDQCPPSAGSASYLQLVEKLVQDSVLPKDNRQHSPGRDAAFELYIGAVCTAAKLCPVRWEEPDVTCTLDGERYGLAAKRLKSLNNLEKHVRKAVEQIERSGMKGLVVLDLALAFNPENHRLRGMPDSLFANEYQKRFRSIWRGHQAKVQALMSSDHVLGIVVHDYIVREKVGAWGVDGMTMRVEAHAREIQDLRLYGKLSTLYIYGLPNQSEFSEQDILLP